MVVELLCELMTEHREADVAADGGPERVELRPGRSLTG
jgi:hypothetical protein